MLLPGLSSRAVFCPAERKKLKRRASKVSDDQQQSDRESGEQMSDDPHVDMSTALVQYHQHSPDFAAMLRGFPEISEVPSPTQVRDGLIVADSLASDQHGAVVFVYVCMYCIAALCTGWLFIRRFQWVCPHVEL